MASSMTLIETKTVGAGGASSIDFTVPQTYTDLMLVYSLRHTFSGQYADINLVVNGATSASGKVLYTINGSTVAAYSPTSAAVIETNAATSTANTFSNGSVYISNYTSTNLKIVSADNVTETNASAAAMTVNAVAITNGAAITSISLPAVGSNTFVQYSSVSLYGVSNTWATGTAKATGGTISYGMGGIVYHTFTGSGTFTPSAPLTADVLVVAGGGAGRVGGGGAGGLQLFSSQSLSNIGYAVTIGAGGASSDWSASPSPGANSSFNTLISVGGGGGGNVNGGNAPIGSFGGSGGGAGAHSSVNYSGGDGIAGQGNRGGSRYATGNNQYGGGGGGAGAQGADNGNNAIAAGGAGLAYYGATYATGGNSMAANTTGSAGAANTGNGGAGGFTGGAGGSGVVIVRYQG